MDWHHSRTQTLLIIPKSKALGNPNLPEARILLEGHHSACSYS
jgi:hypothetical protein